jgi:hypothetical protein
MAFLLLTASSLSLGASNREMLAAASDDTLLANAGVEPGSAELRLPCSAAVVETDDPPEFFNCVYVQTDRALNLFSLEGGFLLSELQITLDNIDGVALQHMGRYSQVQIFSGKRVAALYIHNDSWIDPAKTEQTYQWLLNHGVRTHEAVRWIGP